MVAFLFFYIYMSLMTFSLTQLLNFSGYHFHFTSRKVPLLFSPYAKYSLYEICCHLLLLFVIPLAKKYLLESLLNHQIACR